MNIIVKKTENKTEVVFHSTNFRECLNEFENIALDHVQALGGESVRKIRTSVERGYNCIKGHNKLTIINKMKNGYLTSGETHIICEYEFIYFPMNRIVAYKVNKTFCYTVEYDEVVKQLQVGGPKDYSLKNETQISDM
jgi:hypothetical protein